MQPHVQVQQSSSWSVREHSRSLHIMDIPPPGVELLQAVLIQPNLRHPAGGRKDRHDFHEAIYLVRGSYAAEVAGLRQVLLRPGQTLIYPAGTEHQSRMPRDGKTRYHLVQWRGWCPTTTAAVSSDPGERIRSTLDWIVDRFESDRQGNRELVEQLLAALLLEWKLEHTGNAAAADPIENVRRFMQRHLHYLISLQDCLNRSGLSRTRFCIEFRRRYGCSPMAYLRRERLAAAQRLRVQGDLTLAEIGQRVGIADPLYLSRLLSRNLRDGAFAGAA